jgi:APA family basic amino acid/polyamine antiporter
MQWRRRPHHLPEASMSTASAPPAGSAPPVDQEPRGTLGLGAATALIVGSIIGVGIFNLPADTADA